MKFELIVTADADLVGEISIAGNLQNDVMTVSIVAECSMSLSRDLRFMRTRQTG